jgi:hypothetical protein
VLVPLDADYAGGAFDGLGLLHVDERYREELTATLSRELASRPDVSLAWVFGSFLRPGGFRDIDVAVCVDGRGGDPNADLDLAVRLSRAAGVLVESAWQTRRSGRSSSFNLLAISVRACEIDSERRDQSPVQLFELHGPEPADELVRADLGRLTSSSQWRLVSCFRPSSGPTGTWVDSPWRAE